MMQLPEQLPPLARPERGRLFPGGAEEARERALSLDRPTLTAIRDQLENLYGFLTESSDFLRSPLGRNRHWRTWDRTAQVVDELRDALLNADGETVGFALAQMDEEYEWRALAGRAAS